MTNRKELLSWRHREENLRKIERYHKFVVMFYRTNDLIHSKRVGAMLEEILPYIIKLYPEFDVTLAKLIALHHDNHEIIMKGGDISLQLKLDMIYNGDHEGLRLLHQEEILATEKLSESYPKKIKGYNYKEIALHAILKDCMEAQAVSFVDKIDGYSEAIHEVLAGNLVFLEPVINYLSNTFNDLVRAYPLIKELFEIKNVWFDLKSVVDLKDFFEDGLIGGKPHTKETIDKKTVIPQYEMWKKITLKNFGIEPLVNQAEFHHNTK
ncbi:MAG: YfbR-like 5'-deoxynucleotidase [Candidatus Paceibacterota bacterium]